MIGWRARIGFLLPPDNAVLEYEVNRLPIPGVSFHVARMTVNDLGALPENALYHVPSLKECQVQFILYACAASSFMFGSRANQELEQKIRERSGLDALTATSCMVLALRSLGIRNVALATPYPRDLDERLLDYFRNEKIRVPRIQSLRLDTWEAVNNQTLDAVYGLVRRTDHPEADGILILSTNLPTFKVLQILEEDLGKPVVSSNQSMVWAACTRLGIREEVRGLGRLWEQTHRI
jgi:maleate isomerase